MMKSIILLVLITFNFSFSQNGKVYPKNPEIKPEIKNIFIYEPPTDVNFPENASVKIVHRLWKRKSVPLIKKEDKYEFSLKVPDSIDVLILSIVGKNNKALDNNNDKGYVVYLKYKTKEELESAKISQLSLNGFANYILKLNIDPSETINQFEKLFAQNPKLKEDNAYDTYLYLKYDQNKKEAKPLIVEYAQKNSKNENEKGLTKAHEFYSLIKMSDESNEIEKIILKRYPNGELAKRQFRSDFYKHKDKTEKYILESLKEFSIRFNDHSKETKNEFYSTLINIYLKNKDLKNLNKYEALITDKINIAHTYNSYAWGLSGENLTSSGSDLEYAELLSKKTLDIIKNRILHPKENEDPIEFQGTYNMFADTYALILYKQKKYDLAFQYQDEIKKQNQLENPGGKERYAAYAEKTKSLEFVKDYLEKELTSGVNSKVMLNQLQNIYQKLKIPESEFQKIKETSSKIASKKAKEELLKKYGDIKAIDFTLTNLEGEKIKLSDYKGKIVVLDFWATWCGPCRASFPKMQELVDKYKNKDVEFFFINTWERKKPSEINKSVSKFIKDNKYTFNVLFDYDDGILEKYKVDGIPTKIVINKNGDIISIDSSDDNLQALINEGIK